jgi:hypothetical protein
MNTLISFNPKFAAYTIEDLQRIGSTGDEEAILELGRRSLEHDFNFEPECDTEATCPECDCTFDI